MVKLQDNAFFKKRKLKRKEELDYLENLFLFDTTTYIFVMGKPKIGNRPSEEGV